MEKNDPSQQNSTQPPNFQAIVKKATRQKTLQNTLKRKIQMMKKGKFVLFFLFVCTLWNED